MWKNGAISRSGGGRRRRPIVRAAVSALIVSPETAFVSGLRYLERQAPTDRGVYRLADLPPGRYIIALIGRPLFGVSLVTDLLSERRLACGGAAGRGGWRVTSRASTLPKPQLGRSPCQAGCWAERRRDQRDTSRTRRGFACFRPMHRTRRPVSMSRQLTCLRKSAAPARATGRERSRSRTCRLESTSCESSTIQGSSDRTL